MSNGHEQNSSGQLPNLNSRLLTSKTGLAQKMGTRRPPKREQAGLVREPSTNIVAKTTEARRRVLEVYEYEIRPQLRERSSGTTALKEMYLPEDNPDSQEALTHLVQELVFLFIATFHQDSMSSWRILLETLLHIQPVCHSLQEYPQIEHYLRRVRYHASARVEKTFMIRVLDIVAKLFPDVVGPNANMENTMKLANRNGSPRRKLSLRNSPTRRNVFKESATDISDKGTVPKSARYTSVKDFSNRITINTNQGLPLTGKDAIEYFRKPEQSQSCKMFYLIEKSRPQLDPYDLVVVPKTRVVQNPQPYYLVTKSEVVFVDEDGTSEHFSHLEWLRDSENFQLLLSLPTFKHFLLREAFQRWRNYSGAIHEQRWKRELTSNLLLASPPLVLPLQFMMRALSSISELQIIRLNADEDPTIYIQQKCLTLRPTLSRALMEVQSSLAMARTQVLASFDTYRKFRKHPALRKLKQSLYLSKEDSHRKKHLLQLASKVERMHNLAYHKTASHVSELLEKSFTAAQHGPPFSCSLALRKGIDSSETDLQERIFLEADLTRLREKLSTVVQTLTHAVAETLVECEIRNKHNLMFGVETQNTPNLGSPNNPVDSVNLPPPVASSSSVTVDASEVDLPECFTTYHSFMSRLAKQITGSHVVKRNLKIIDEKLDAATDYVNNFIEESSLKSMVRFLERTDMDQLKKFLNSDQSQEIVDQISEWNFFLTSKLPDSFVTRPPVLVVSCRGVREKLSGQLSVFLSRITDNAKLFVIQKSIPLNRTLSDILQVLKWNENASWSEYIDFFYKYNHSLDSSLLLRKEIYTLETYFSVLCCLQSDLPEDADKIHRDLHFLWHSLRYTLRQCKLYLENNREAMLTSMEVVYKASMTELNVCLSEVSDGIFVNPTSNVEDVQFNYSQIFRRFTESLAACDKIRRWKTDAPGLKLNLPNTEALNQKFVARGDLWNEYSQTEKMNSKWLNMNITNELLTDVEINVQKWHSKADNLCKYLPDHDSVLVAWQSKVDHWKKVLPLLRDLLESVKDDNDWMIILNGLGASRNQNLAIQCPPSIGDLINLEGFTTHGEWVDRVCQLLARREKVEKLVHNIVQYWFSSRLIPTKNGPSELIYKSKSPRNRLRSGGDSHGQAISPAKVATIGIINLLNLLTKVKDDKNQLETYRDIVFHELREKLNSCLSLLNSIKEMLKMCYDYQSKFQLLQKYLPLIKMDKDDGFLLISRSYEIVMEWITIHSFPICHVTIPKLFNTEEYLYSWLEVHQTVSEHGVCFLSGNYTLMSKIASLDLELECLFTQLGEFLKKDLSNFPRLYLLSEEERLEFYSQSVVSFSSIYDSPYLRRCFPAISKISVTKDPVGNSWLLRLHGDGECLAIPEAPATSATLAQWLSSLQVAIGRYLRRTICQGANELYETTDFNKFVTSAIESESYPVQTVLVIAGLWWTKKLSDVLECDGNNDVLEELNLKLSQARMYLVAKAGQFRRAKKTSMASNFKIEGLLYQLDYYQSVIEGMGQISNGDFKWKTAMQLNPVKSSSHLIDDVSISISDNVQKYGYAYVGPSVADMYTKPILEKSAVLLALNMTQGQIWPKIINHSSFTQELVAGTAKILGLSCFRLIPCNDGKYLDRFTRYLTATMMDGSWLILEPSGCLPEDLVSVRSHLKHIVRCLDIHDLRSKNDTSYSAPVTLDFKGGTLSVHSSFVLCVVSAEENALIEKDINRLRLLDVCEPNWNLVVEAQLRAIGLTQDLARVSQQVCVILRQYREEIVPNRSFLSQIRTFIKMTRQNFNIPVEKDVSNLTQTEMERMIVRNVLIRHFLSNISDQSIRAKYEAMIKEDFKSDQLETQSNTDWLLRTRIKESLFEMRIEANVTLLDKCVELYEILLHNRLVLLTGPPASGKTLCCRVLVRVFNNYEHEIVQDSSKVHFEHLIPGSWRRIDFERWLLEYKSTRWKPATKEEQSNCSEKEWLLLDGEAEHSWYKSSSFRDFCQDCFRFDKCCLILEISDAIKDNDPSFFDNFAVVNFGQSGLDWTALVNGFLTQLPFFNPVSLAEVDRIRSWLYQLIPKASQLALSMSVDFKSRNWTVSESNRAVSIFLNVYDAVLRNFYHSEDIDEENGATILEDERLSGPLVYSLLWSFGGSINFQCQKDRLEFERHFGQCLGVCSPPLDSFLPKHDDVNTPNYSLFDYHLIPITGKWEKLTNMLTLDVRGKLKGSSSSTNTNYVGEGLTAGVRSIVSILRKAKIPTLITGGHGVGKTALLKYLVCEECDHKIDCRFLGASSGTTAEDFRLVCVKKSSDEDTEDDLFFIIDDLHLAGKSSLHSGDSDPREWIRSALTDPSVCLTVSATSDALWSPRLMRQLVKIHLPAPDVNLLTSCYGKALDYWLTPSTRGNALLAALSVTQALIEATVDFHHAFLEKIRASSKYLYSWQHVHRVFKKLITVDATSENSSSVPIPAIWCLVVECVYASTASRGQEWNDQLWSIIKKIAVTRFAKSKTPSHLPYPNSPATNTYVTRDRNLTSSNKDEFVKSLDITKDNFVLVPDVYSKRMVFKPKTSSNLFNYDGNLFLPSEQVTISRLTRSLVFPDGHAILTSEDRWVGKETCTIGVAKLLSCHTVTINHPADQLNLKENSDDSDSLLLDQCSNVLYWDNLWKISTRSRTATKSGKLPSLRVNSKDASYKQWSPVKSFAPKSGIPVLIGKEGKRLKSSKKPLEKEMVKQGEKGDSSVISKLQECLHKAGVKGDPVILIVNLTSMDRGDPSLNWLLDTLQSLIIHGDCNWLRTLRNNDHVLHYMQLLFLSEHERDRNFLYSRFVSRVQKNLRVLICVQTKVLGKILEVFPFTSHISGLVSVESWKNNDWIQYTSICSRNLQNNLDEMMPKFLSKVHQQMMFKLGHNLHPSHLARALHWCSYLLSYLENSNCDTHAWKKGLDELSVIRSTLDGLDRRLDPLQEEQRQLDSKLEFCEDSIVACEEEYALLQEHCATFEEDLRQFKEQLEEAQTETRRLLRDSQPVYQSALNQLLMLIPSRLQELKSYRAPPPAVTKVLGAFCLLFKIPQNFDSAKQYIMSEYLPALLQQFNWESVPEEVYSELSKIVEEPSLSVEMVAQSSEAAAALWRWIRAVHNFLQIKYTHKELYGEMMESQSLIKEREDALKRDRSTLEAVENELNSRRQELQDLETIRTGIGEKIGSLQQEAEILRQLLYAVRWSEDRWTLQCQKKNKPSTESLLGFVVNLVYSGLRHDDEDFDALLKQSGFDSATHNAVTDFILSGDVKSFLMTEGIPSDTETMSSFLAFTLHLKRLSPWNCVLLQDPYDYATKWTQLAWDLISRQDVDNVPTELNLVTFNGDDANLLELYRELDSSHGTIVLIQDVEYLDAAELESVIKSTKNRTLLSTKLNYHLLDGFPKSFYELPVIEIGCTGSKGLVEVLTHKLLQARHPTLFRQIRELEDLRAVKCQEAERAEEEVIASLQSNSWTLERLEEISKRQDQLAIRVSKLETEIELELSPHKEAARRIIIVANHVYPHVSSQVPGLKLSPTWIFDRACDTKYDDDLEVKSNANTNAVISQRHFWAVFCNLTNFLDVQRMEDLIYQLALEIAKDMGQIEPEEKRALIDNHYNVQQVDNGDKPTWLTTQEWSRINSLVSVFPAEFVKDLKGSVSSEGGQYLWKAYCDEPFSPTTFPPLKIKEQLTLTQNALLKSALCSKQTSQIRWTLSSIFLGSMVEQCHEYLISGACRTNLKTFIRDPILNIIILYFDGKYNGESKSPADDIISLQRDANVMVFSCKKGDRWTGALMSAIEKTTAEGLWLLIEEPENLTWTAKLTRTIRKALKRAPTDFKIWFLVDINRESNLPAFADAFAKVMVW